MICSVCWWWARCWGRCSAVVMKAGQVRQASLNYPFRYPVSVSRMLMSGRVRDGLDHEAGVALVDAGQGVVKADRDSSGDAGGQEEHAPFPAAGRQLAGVEGGDRGFPVGAGHQGGAAADAGADGDEPAGEVLAVLPAPDVPQGPARVSVGMEPTTPEATAD